MTDPTTPTEAMLDIIEIAPNATILFSEFTHGWYVDARIEIGGDGLLSGVTEHRATPDTAVLAYHERLRSVRAPYYIATNASTEQRQH